MLIITQHLMCFRKVVCGGGRGNHWPQWDTASICMAVDVTNVLMPLLHHLTYMLFTSDNHKGHK